MPALRSVSGSGCRLCPRACAVDRAHGAAGYCRSGNGAAIASICLHQGEEPALGGERGICNVFFYHCNLQCVYCQNHQISRNQVAAPTMDWEEAQARITAILASGVRHLGFVSPSHMQHALRRLVAALNAAGHKPVVVYNSGGYDSVAALRELEGIVDIYLPDFKYADAALADRYSQAADYPAVALAALREMIRQVGTTLFQDEDGLAVRGMIIRHLVLPGQVENSLQVLRTIAGELSPRLHLSLMAQYHPTEYVAAQPSLDRRLRAAEYDRVIAEMERLGFGNGWLQALDSPGHYNPDFDRAEPFSHGQDRAGAGGTDDPFGQ